ncbi:nuclear transport factor 2 family protein [Youngiibacter multivorans]|uniref:Nuclear transport factor 2 (NTF2) superfamily protein n=1 Tax=Youngiibacter multivorans TaxID=937251 RepID=A0ABS4G403_9CLOT|nr:nuclear transport factor 2 family protein [Youngiibacter multivorans]MBP1919251.1 nuclear transport factor 2 (NTF2) superfamily protein [Youngiibacter multivorans]
MSEIPVIDLIREVRDAFNSHDIEKILSMTAEDSVWTTSSGIFRGKAEVRRYLVWFFDGIKNFTLHEIGIGTVAKDRWGVSEYYVTGTVDKKPVEFPGYSTYEFDESNKMKSKKIIFDRLGLAEMIVDDIVSKKVVHTVAKKVQEGLD